MPQEVNRMLGSLNSSGPDPVDRSRRFENRPVYSVFGALRMLRSHGIVTTNANPVSLRVSEVRPVIVRVIVCSQAGRTFART